MTQTRTKESALKYLWIHIIQSLRKEPYGTDEWIQTVRIAPPAEFLKSHPSPQKMKLHTKFYIDNGYFDKPILVQRSPNTNSEIVFLRDGYIRYRIAVLNNIKTVPIRWYDKNNNKGDK